MIAPSLMTAALLASSWPQLDSTATLRGKASSSFNGHPLAGVMISVPAAQKFVVTDSAGRFWLGGLPSGVQLIRVSYDGRETNYFQFALRGQHVKDIAVLLDIEAVDLDPIVVEVRQVNGQRDLAGFFERRGWYRGFARFFTREEIDHVRPTKISGLLTLEGIATRCFELCMPTRFSRGALCAVPINVNGLPWGEDNFDRIEVSQVAAVEVYRGEPPYGLSPALAVSPGSSIWMGGGFPTRGNCGLVMIWTR
jgi:hypothetical protein